MFKRANVVMLPTNEKARKSLKLYSGTRGYGEYNPIHESANVQSFHIYIV